MSDIALPKEVMESFKQNDELNNYEENLTSNWKTSYYVKAWDSFDEISRKYWITTKSLILFNYLYWITFDINWSNVKIKEWDLIYIPENTEAFNSAFQDVQVALEILSVNTKLNTSKNLNLFKESLWMNIFPNKPQSIWFKKYLDWFRLSQELELDPKLPRVVDIENQEKTTCANFVRTLMWQSVNTSDLNEKEGKFLQKQWIDAWMLPEELKKIWFEQKNSLMEYFDGSMVLNENPINNNGSYLEWTIRIWNKLKSNPDKYKWSFVPYYFQHSNFKYKVKDYNSDKNEKHFNTHQSIFVWDWVVNLKAWDIKNFTQGSFNDWLSSFIFDRADYEWANLENIKSKVNDNIWKYLEFIDLEIESWSDKIIIESWTSITINWEKTYSLDTEDYNNKINYILLKVINKDDKIKIKSPMMIDWEKQSNSNESDRKNNMNGRTRFYFEFLSSDYLPTEMLVPWEDSSFSKENLSPKLEWLNVIWIYDLREWENLKNKLREHIKNYFEKTKTNWNKLSEDQKNLEINNEYSNQIMALQLAWFTQDWVTPNKWATNINRAIPFFDTSNIKELHNKHIESKRKEFLDYNRKNSDIKWFILLPVFYWDTEKKIFRNLQEYITNYIPNKWEEKSENNNLYKIKSLNDFQISNFMLLLKSKLNIKDLEPNKVFVLKISEINEVIWDIDKPSELLNEDPNLSINQIKVNEMQKDVMNRYIPNEYNRSLANIILRIESWDDWFRKTKKQIWEELDKISSFWNFQLQLFTLSKPYDKWGKNSKWENERWPNDEFPKLEHLTNAINNAIDYYKNWLKKEDKTDESKEDFSTIKSIKRLLDELNSDNIDYKNWKSNLLSLEKISNKLKQIHILLKKVLRLSSEDEVWENILWDVISSSLISNKLDTHISHLSYNLQAIWETNWLTDKEEKKSFDKIVCDINNRWEDKVMYSLIENYIIRAIKCLNQAFWKQSVFPTKWVYKSYSPLTETKKWATKWWYLDYSEKVFLEHIKSYYNFLNSFWNDPSIEPLKNKLALVNDKSSWLKFVQDKEVQKMLVSKWKSTSLLPTKKEFFDRDFQIEVFSYPNKIDKIKE